MIKYILIALGAFLLSSSQLHAQNKNKQKEENKAQLNRDGKINYPKQILVNPDFDFKIKSTQKGKFIVSFYKSQSKPITIKIYDITGNLVLQESVLDDGSFSKEYDLSYYKPKFFVVEVGSSQYNKTKSVFTE
jgi:hypothetical protein